MSKHLSDLSVSRDLPAPLQDQLRRQIIDAIARGAFREGMRLPSSRSLAKDLGVARNTVAAVYERLIADGHLSSRRRSGVFVRPGAVSAPPRTDFVSGPNPRAADDFWSRRTVGAPAAIKPGPPPNWDAYPYPFIAGPFDASLFPINEWRDATRRTLGVADIEAWSRDPGDADDPLLIAEIQRKILPQRGFAARSDEILVTTGAQQALQLCAELFAAAGTKVAVEEPGCPETRAAFQRRGATCAPIRVDADGVDSARLFAASPDIAVVTPSSQRPTGVALSSGRRAAFVEAAQGRRLILIEHDHYGELSGIVGATALRGDPGGSDIIYAATLAQPLAPAVRLGVLVAPAPVIRAARELRRLSSRQPAISLQRTFAHMIALGHYASTIRRADRAFRARAVALRDALNHYFPNKAALPPRIVGPAAWVRFLDRVDLRDFVVEAEARGALVETGDGYFQGAAPGRFVRLGVTGTPVETIRPGMEVLTDAFRAAAGGAASNRRFDPAKAADDAELLAACSGATLLTKTVYGDPCTIELHADGRMSGAAGAANEDRDEGRWWIEDGWWCRRWSVWAYGETARFRASLEGDRIKWFHADGRLIDWAVLKRAVGGGQRPV
ncbi:MAG: PLP-dependent aminotransferase family protein [Pseudomonadota bacterium]